MIYSDQNSNISYAIIKTPKMSKWTAHLMDFSYNPTEASEPKTFHRFMLSLFFGVTWTRQGPSGSLGGP